MDTNEQIASSAVEKALTSARRCVAIAGIVTALAPLSSVASTLPGEVGPGSGICTANGPGSGSGTAYCGTYKVGTMSTTTTITPVGSGFTINYHIHSDGAGYAVDPDSIGCQNGGENGGCTYVDGFSIPEFNYNDLTFTSLPSGWTTSQTSFAVFSGASVPGYAGNLVYLNVFFNSDYDYCQTHDCEVTARAGYAGDDPPNNPIYTGFDFSASAGDGGFAEGSFGYSSGQMEDPPIFFSRGTNTQQAVIIRPAAGVPEPSVLAMFGIGAAAFLGARRRRKR